MKPRPITVRVPSCAMCGATLRGKGWFCSPRCDEAELRQRFAVSKARFEAAQAAKADEL